MFCWETLSPATAQRKSCSGMTLRNMTKRSKRHSGLRTPQIPIQSSIRGMCKIRSLPSNPQELKNHRTMPCCQTPHDTPRVFCPRLEQVRAKSDPRWGLQLYFRHFSARTRRFPAGHCSVRWSMLFTSLSECSWNSDDYLNGVVLVQEAVWVFH